MPTTRKRVQPGASRRNSERSVNSHPPEGGNCRAIRRARGRDFGLSSGAGQDRGDIRPSSKAEPELSSVHVSHGGRCREDLAGRRPTARYHGQEYDIPAIFAT